MEKCWRVLEQDPELIEKLSQDYNLDPLLAKCILNRDIPKHQSLNTFLSPDTYQPPDPFLMPDMQVAVVRIIRAIEAGERICVYGDYDADGITAIAILIRAIRELGGDVFYYIPDRFFEGVGLQSSRLQTLKEEDHVALVITVDTGVRAFEEMHFAREIGIDVIITDHHLPSDERPEALAVINPKLPGSEYPFHYLCGAGVALKLVQALDLRLPAKLDISHFIKIAAIGTIADMVPLHGENRWIVSEGLKAIAREEDGPICNLLKRVGVRGEAHAMDISFRLAPRINAPGRLGDPDTAISFFECVNHTEVCRIIETMEGMNKVRQNLEKELEVRLNVLLRSSFRRELPPFIVLAGRNWHRGILGIMACKMLRRFCRPVCVLSFDAKEAHGSMRGLPGINLMDSLNQVSSLLNSFGGHPEAAGVSLPITNLPQFKERMSELLRPQVDANPDNNVHIVDAELEWNEIDRHFFETISALAPFGIGNSPPTFLTAGLILESELSRKGPWYHFEVSDGNIARKCSYYHPEEIGICFERFDSVDLVYNLAPYREHFQIQIIEMRPS